MANSSKKKSVAKRRTTKSPTRIPSKRRTTKSPTRSPSKRRTTKSPTRSPSKRNPKGFLCKLPGIKEIGYCKKRKDILEKEKLAQKHYDLYRKKEEKKKKEEEEEEDEFHDAQEGEGFYGGEKWAEDEV